MKIKTVSVFYENVVIFDNEGNKYFISDEELQKILSKQEFIIEKKKTRTWLKLKE